MLEEKNWAMKPFDLLRVFARWRSKGFLIFVCQRLRLRAFKIANCLGEGVANNGFFAAFRFGSNLD